MAMLLKIAAFGLVGFVLLAEATAEFIPPTRVPRHDKLHVKDIIGHGAALAAGAGHDHGHGAAALGALASGIAKSAAVGAEIGAATGGIGAGVGTGGIGGGIGGAGVGLGGVGGGLGNHAATGGKVVLDIKTKNHEGCKCGNPQVHEFGHNLALAIRAYTSKELVPELKKVAAKFVDYVMGYLAKEKPNEMAQVQNILQSSARVTADANARAGSVGGLGGGAGGLGGIGGGGVAVGGASAGVF